MIDNINNKVTFSLTIYRYGFPTIANKKAQSVTTTPQTARGDGTLTYVCSSINDNYSELKPKLASDYSYLGSGVTYWAAGYYTNYKNATSTKKLFTDITVELIIDDVVVCKDLTTSMTDGQYTCSIKAG